MDEDPILTALTQALEDLKSKRDLVPFKGEEGRQISITIMDLEKVIAYYQQYVAG
jgi:hypothetical protein